MKYFHVWFSTKFRKGALESPEIAELVLTTMRLVAARTSIAIEEMEVAVDHMHLLLRLEEHQSLAVVMQDLKGASSRAVHEAFPELQTDMGSHAFWQKGYGSRLVPEPQVNKVKQYIKTQMDRPLRS